MTTATFGTPTKASPVWTNDFLGPEHLMVGAPSKLDPAAFFARDAVVVDVGAAGAAAGAVTVPVSPALSGPIPSGTVLWFSGAKFARLSAAAATGAVSLAVTALPTALVDADVATYPGVLPRAVPGGTIVGRTIAERDASAPYGPAADADDEVFITAFDVSDVSRINDVELVRPNTTIKENFLPVWTTISAAVKAKVRASYRCMRGAE